jgi:hypothetical protein
VRVMKAVRDTPSSDGACVYEVSSNYVERIKRYGPDKQKVNRQTDTRTFPRLIHYVAFCLPSDTLCVFIFVWLATHFLLCKYKFYGINQKIATQCINRGSGQTDGRTDNAIP